MQTCVGCHQYFSICLIVWLTEVMEDPRSPDPSKRALGWLFGCDSLLKTLQQAAMKRAAVKGKISFLALGE
jgi:hypothetical protein